MAAPSGLKALWSRLAFPLGFTSLVVAFVIGQIAAEPDYEALLKRLLAENDLSRLSEAEGGQVVFRDDTQGNYVVISEGDGYGGPLVVGIRASAEGQIAEILDLENRETPAYFEKLLKARFFRQFARKTVSDDFLVGVDIDAVSGATVSSEAFTTAVRNAMHIAATEHFGLKPTWQQPALELGVQEFGLVGVFALAFLVSYAKGPLAKWGRMAMPFVALGFVGIYTNSSLSVGQIGGVVLGFIPPFRDHPLWWIMMAGVAISVVLLGRNIYCAQVCPFQYVERALNKISGINLAVRPGMQKAARTVVRTMTWTALMLIFLSAHPTLGSYEPFSMMFSLTGTGVQWYILPMSLIGSFFVLNFWCRLFCPVGMILNDSVRARRTVMKRLRRPAAAPARLEVLPADADDKGDLWRRES